MSQERIFPERDPKSVQQATLCFLVRQDEVLLAFKKRGFGVGLWNGVGGKVQEGESLALAARREAFEEIGVHVSVAEEVALLHFYFPQDPEKQDWNQDVHVFLVKEWLGEPKETEEMRPKWFKSYRLGYLSMWADDKYWLPRVLDGERVEGWFAFDADNNVIAHKVANVEEGGDFSSQR
jgi:8-oxo-dGTP pyrophosphatase MutT (NUDIX family)